jgi:selenocysteine-specific elongation factor
MKNRLVATAGHVDHGKSALLHALTGQETDRLDEEQERGLTIDLGFAHLEQDGLQVGFIDVPGHHNFIKNMVSGVGSVQGILFVISAKDGWEAQSREHFEIVKLLEPEYCSFVLTKIDLVDEEMQLLARAEIEDAIESTPYETADILPVSSETGEGISELKNQLTNKLSQLDDPADYDKPYLPVDRIFSVKGQGTVVTGSLSGGAVKENDELGLKPGGSSGRVRGIQKYHASVNEAGPGSRVALNVPDWDREEVHRGDVVSDPTAGSVADRVDGFLETPEESNVQVSHDSELLTYLGTDRKKAKILVAKERTLGQNESALARLQWFDESVFVRPGDRIILRDFSDRNLLGCLTVLSVSPGQTLTDANYRQWLLDRRPVTPESLLSSELEREAFVRGDELADGTIFSRERFRTLVQESDKYRFLVDDWIVNEKEIQERLASLEDQLNRYHEENPLKPGMPVEAVREMFPTLAVMKAVLSLEEADSLRRTEDYVTLRGFEPAPEPDQSRAIDNLLESLSGKGLETPSRDELEERYAPEVIDYLVHEDQLVELSESRLVHRNDFEELKQTVTSFLQQEEKARLSQLRDLLESSRKYVIPFMEYLDREGLTVRDGDYRYLRE